MVQNRLVVYIAAPYTKPDPMVNMRNAMLMWKELWDAGYLPICPHWSGLQHFLTPMNYEEWMEYDCGLVKMCDAILRLPGESSGADREEGSAKGIGIPVYYGLDTLRRELCPSR